LGRRRGRASDGRPGTCSPGWRLCPGVWGRFAGFFFQAEDGIRDFHVTGVQTCALPISLRARAVINATGVWAGTLVPSVRLRPSRSEERRVGKECRSRGAPERKETKGTGASCTTGGTRRVGQRGRVIWNQSGASKNTSHV